jgi:hypothetical protein
MRLLGANGLHIVRSHLKSSEKNKPISICTGRYAVVSAKDNLQRYYDSIPIGAKHAISRAELCKLWNMHDRKVRNIIAELRAWDNGDDMAIVSSSHGKGYFRTRDKTEIDLFRKEMEVRARNTFAPLKKVRRLLLPLEDEDLFGGKYA